MAKETSTTINKIPTLGAQDFGFDELDATIATATRSSLKSKSPGTRANALKSKEDSVTRIRKKYHATLPDNYFVNTPEERRFNKAINSALRDANVEATYGDQVRIKELERKKVSTLGKKLLNRYRDRTDTHPTDPDASQTINEALLMGISDIHQARDNHRTAVEKLYRSDRKNFESLQLIRGKVDSGVRLKISRQLEKMTQFNDNFLMNYYKRSLELQHKHYFTTREILSLNKAHYGDVAFALATIIENTTGEEGDEVSKGLFKAIGGNPLKKGPLNSLKFLASQGSVGAARRLPGTLFNLVKDNLPIVRKLEEDFIAAYTERKGRLSRRIDAGESFAARALQGGAETDPIELKTSKLVSNATKDARYDVMSRRSVVEIIPGYLSRILEQVTNMATGTINDRVTYSAEREDFITVNQLRADIQDNVVTKINRTVQRDALRIVQRIDTDGELGAAAREELTAAITADAVRGETFDPIRYANEAPKRFKHGADIQRVIVHQFKLTGDASTGYSGYDPRAYVDQKAHDFRLKGLNKRFDSLTSDSGKSESILKASLGVGESSILRDIGFTHKPDGSRVDDFNHQYYQNILAGNTGSSGFMGPLPGGSSSHGNNIRDSILNTHQQQVEEAQNTRLETLETLKEGFSSVSTLIAKHARTIAGARRAGSAGHTGDTFEDASFGDRPGADADAGAMEEDIKSALEEEGIDPESVKPGVMKRLYTNTKRLGLVSTKTLIKTLKISGILVGGAAALTAALPLLGMGGAGFLGYKGFKVGKKLARDVMKPDAEVDIYVKGQEDIPAMRAIDIKRGNFIDQNTKKVIRHISDITGPVVNLEGNIVLSEEDYKIGLVNGRGALLGSAIRWVNKKGMQFLNLGNVATMLPMRAVNKAIGAADKFLKRPYDVYVGDEMKPRLLAMLFTNNGYFAQGSNRPINHPSDINGPIVDTQGNVILTSEDIQMGLTDIRGNKLRKGGLASLVGRAALGAIKMGTKFVTAPFKVKKGLKRMKNITTGILGGAGNVLGRVLGVRKGGSNLAGGEHTLTDVVDMLGMIYEQLALSNPMDNKTMRVADRIRKRFRKGKNNPQDEAAASAKRQEGILADIRGGLSRDEDDETSTGWRGILKRRREARKLAAEGEVKGGFLSKAMKRMGGTRAGAAVGRVGVAAATAVSAATSAAVSAALASAVPAGVATATVATLSLITYAAYKANKKYGSLDPFERIRFIQYGIQIEMTERVTALRYLESQVHKVVTVDSSGGVRLDSGKLPEFVKTMAVAFNIKDDNTEQMVAFDKWFKRRFLPIYGRYMIAGAAISGKKVEIREINSSLSHQQQLDLLGYISITSNSFGTDIWSENASPFPDQPLMPNAREESDKLIETLRNRAISTGAIGLTTEEADTTWFARTTRPVKNLFSSKTASYEALRNREANLRRNKPRYYEKTIEKMWANNDQHWERRYNETGELSGPMREKHLASQQELMDGAPKFIEPIGDGLLMPTTGVVSSVPGMRNINNEGERAHKGFDIAAAEGTPVYAALGGKISRAEKSPTYGNVVYLDHPDGSQTRYAHMVKFAEDIKVGTVVRKGQLLGYVGNTGDSHGAHLHFELRGPLPDGKTIADYGGSRWDYENSRSALNPASMFDGIGKSSIAQGTKTNVSSGIGGGDDQYMSARIRDKYMAPSYDNHGRGYQSAPAIDMNPLTNATTTAAAEATRQRNLQIALQTEQSKQMSLLLELLSKNLEQSDVKLHRAVLESAKTIAELTAPQRTINPILNTSKSGLTYG